MNKKIIAKLITLANSLDNLGFFQASDTLVKIASGPQYFMTVGEVDDALLSYGPKLFPVCIGTPIPQESAKVREMGIKSHIHVVVHLIEVRSVPVVVDASGSFVSNKLTFSYKMNGYAIFSHRVVHCNFFAWYGV